MSHAAKSVILIEFNELTPRLMGRFMAAGLLPNFKRFHDESHIFVTDAECEGEDLNPWVQWVTVHTGLGASEHGIKWLSDGHKLATKAVWDLLSAAGLRVWVCGSMNARYDRPLNGYLLPDPWCSGLAPYPEKEFGPYCHVVRGMVQEHTNEAYSLSKLDLLKFLVFMLGHGLSFATVRTIMKQLWMERVSKKYGWRRATLLDHLQWDVFRRYYRKCRPHFATFFLNSTAHFQHVYWRDMEPEAFTVKPAADQSGHSEAILFGYRNMDDLLGRMLNLAGPNTTLLFCTGLSQQPYLRFEETGGKHFYRIKNPQVLGAQLRLKGNFTYNPVMSEQFVLRFEDLDEANQTQDLLGSYRIGNRPAFRMSLQGHDLMVSCGENGVVPQGSLLTTGTRSLPFFDIFYKVDNVKSGYHHPDGMLWVRRPSRDHAIHPEKVSLRSIAPAILEMFDVPRPDFMSCEPFTRISQGSRQVPPLTCGHR